MALDFDMLPVLSDPFEEFSLSAPSFLADDMGPSLFGSLDYNDNDNDSHNTISTSSSSSSSPFDVFGDADYGAFDANASDTSLDTMAPLHLEMQPLTEFDDASMQTPFSPGRDMPATPLGRVRRRLKLYAHETMREGDPFDVVEFLASPHMVLALIVRLDVTALVALSATCRVWNAQYGPLLGAPHSSMRRRFGYDVLAHQAWPMAHAFPYLAARTLSPSLVFNAGKAYPDRGFVEWLTTAVPRDSGVDAVVLLRSYMCGAASSGQQPHLVRFMTLDLLGNYPEEAKRALDWPMGSAIHGEPHEARTFIDFLVKQASCDALFVLLLVNKHHFRMTTFATRAVIAHNTDTPPYTKHTDTVLNGSLITHYIDVLVKQVQASCTTCNAKRIKFVLDSHHAAVVGFVLNQHHVAFMDLVLKAVSIASSQRVKAIEAVLDACTQVNGPALAKVAVQLKSLRLFETAFDRERANPPASATMSETDRINYIISITTQPRAVPLQSTPERAPKRPRTEGTWKKFDEKDYVTASIAKTVHRKPVPNTQARPVSGTHRVWDTPVSNTVFQTGQHH